MYRCLGSRHYFHLVLCTDVLVLSMYFKYFENKVVFLFVTTVQVQCTQEHSIDIRCLASLNVEHLRCIKPADDLLSGHTTNGTISTFQIICVSIQQPLFGAVCSETYLEYYPYQMAYNAFKELSLIDLH